jgi:hypothetical protein
MLDQKQLHLLFKENPCWMFTGEEICEICNVSQNVISRVKAHADSPFFLNKCRPEWFLEWMRTHPEFQLTKAHDTLPSTKKLKEDEDDDELAKAHAKKMAGLKPVAKRRAIANR